MLKIGVVFSHHLVYKSFVINCWKVDSHVVI